MEMENKFRRYCITVFGKISGADAEVKKISEGTMRGIKGAAGIYVATFTSMLDMTNLSDYFTENGRMFILAEIDEETFFANMGKLQNELFIKQDLDQINNTFMSQVVQDNSISGTSSANGYENINVDDLNAAQRDELLNTFIEKGVENLTENDKEIMRKLTQ